MAKKARKKTKEIDFEKDFESDFETDPDLLKNTGDQVPKILFGVFLAVSVILITVASFTAASAYRRMSRELSAPGYIVDLVPHIDNEGETFYYPLVEFYLPDQSRRTVQLTEGSSLPGYQKDAEVVVLYDPVEPSNVRIKSAISGIGLWVLPIILGTMGVGFFAGAMLWLKIHLSDQTNKLAEDFYRNP
jgi:hypothetical protein